MGEKEKGGGTTNGVHERGRIMVIRVIRVIRVISINGFTERNYSAAKPRNANWHNAGQRAYKRKRRRTMRARVAGRSRIR